MAANGGSGRGGLIRTDRVAWVLVGSAFLLSRVGAWLAGVRFDGGQVGTLAQVLDPELLRHDLFRSIWYLHAQPPLFNLLLGLVLRVAPGSGSGALHVLYLGAGLVLMFGLYDLGRQLALGRTLAVGVTVVVGCGSTVIVYENVVNYDFLLMVVVVLLLDAAARWVRCGHLRTLAAFTGLAAVAVLTRSMFHPVWFVVVVGLAIAARRPAWSWKPVAAIVIPGALIVGAMLKNEIMFGTPQLSTWFGGNFNRSAVTSLTPREQDQLRRAGVLHAPGAPRPCRVDHPDIPALARRNKTVRVGPGVFSPNGNWECLIAFNAALGRDAWAAVKAEPSWVARGVAGSFELWAGPSTLYFDVAPARVQADSFDELYRRVVLLDIPWNPPVPIQHAEFIALQASDHRFHVSLTIVAATLLTLAGGFVVLAGWRKRALTPARAAVLIGAATIGFVTLAGNLFEHGENNRFRVVVEPITLVIATAIVAALVRHIRARRQPTVLAPGAERVHHGSVGGSRGLPYSVNGPIFRVAFGVLPHDAAVDGVELDEATQTRGFVGAVEEHPPGRPTQQAAPGELRRRVADREADRA